MSDQVTQSAVVELVYSGGKDEPGRSIFRNHPVQPAFTNELLVAVRSNADPSQHIDLDEFGGVQVHVAGTPRVLEELGRYLIALARLQTADPEPYGSFDDVKYADGGTMRLLPRRLVRLP